MVDIHSRLVGVEFLGRRICQVIVESAPRFGGKQAGGNSCSPALISYKYVLKGDFVPGTVLGPEAQQRTKEIRSNPSPPEADTDGGEDSHYQRQKYGICFVVISCMKKRTRAKLRS